MLSAQQIREDLITKASVDMEFRARLIASPKDVINEEFSVQVPEAFQIQVHEDGPATAHLILAPSPMLTESELGAATGGWTQSNEPNRPPVQVHPCHNGC